MDQKRPQANFHIKLGVFFDTICPCLAIYQLILFENQIQTTSASPCRTQVQPAASFLVCSLIFIEYKRRTTPTTIGPMIVLSTNSIMGYLTSFRRRCRSVEQYYTIKEKLDKNSISGENEVNLPTIKRIVSSFQHLILCVF